MRWVSYLTPLWWLLYLCTGEFYPHWFDLKRMNIGDSIAICRLYHYQRVLQFQPLAWNKSWMRGASHPTPLWLLLYLCTGEFCPCGVGLEWTSKCDSIAICHLYRYQCALQFQPLAWNKSWMRGASHLTPLWLLLYLCTGEFCPGWFDLERMNNGASIVFCCQGVIISMHVIERLECNKSWTWGASHLTLLWLLLYLCIGEFCPCWVGLEWTNNGESIVFCCLYHYQCASQFQQLECNKSWTYRLASPILPMRWTTGLILPCKWSVLSIL